MNCNLLKLCVCLILVAAAPLSAQAQVGQRSAAVSTVLELPRETPVDQLSAVLTLIDLGEPELAAELLAPLLEKNLDDATRAALVGRFGTARMLRLARQEETDFPGARQFVEACMQSSASQARDPKRLARLIADLNHAEAQVRHAAQSDLKTTSIFGAAACLEALAKTSDKTSRTRLLEALVDLRPEIDPLLLAGLATGKGHFQRDLAELAGYTEMLNAVPWLAHFSVCATEPATAAAARTALANMGISSPTPAEVRILLVREIKRLAATDSSEKLLWWTWPATGKFVSQSFSVEQIQTLTADRLAQMLLACGQPTPAEKRLALIYHLEAQQVLEQTASEEIAERFSIDELSSTLAEATRLGRDVAAVACTGELGTRGDGAALLSLNGQPTPLSAALRHPNQDVRFAALEAIFQIAPTQGFAGSSHVVKNLWFFAGQQGQSHDEHANQLQTERANQSLAWLAQLLQQDSPYDETHRNASILSQTLHMPGRTQASLQVLQQIGTAGSQRALLDLANQTHQPIELRRQAVEAFAGSVQHHGKLLTSKQIRQQYDRYNASKSADRKTQQLLGKVLDLLEAKR